MDNQFSSQTRDGFSVCRVENEAASLAVVPELGARVISLRNERTGREWLWHPEPELKLFTNQAGDDFARSPLAGWDECLPTIAPCRWRDRQLPDHGEVWFRSWSLDESAWETGRIAASVDLAPTPFRFTRSLELRQQQVYAEYTLINRGLEAEHFLWAMHPLFALHKGDRLELTPEIRHHLKGQSWVNSLTFPAGKIACAKSFAGPLTEGWAAIVNDQTNDRLLLEWSPGENPILGLWLTRGGWNGHHHLALEPTSGAPDALDIAVNRWKRAGLIAAGETRTWRITLTLETLNNS
jgi:galactose mutarotase-like enzyme